MILPSKPFNSTSKGRATTHKQWYKINEIHLKIKWVRKVRSYASILVKKMTPGTVEYYLVWVIYMLNEIFICFISLPNRTV